MPNEHKNKTNRKSYWKNVKKRREYMRRRMKEERKKNPEKFRDQMLKRRFGISSSDYDAMFKSQNGICLICGQPETIKPKLCVDHDHATGKVRGLLCSHCNLLLGHVKDNISVLTNAISYLLLYRAKKKENSNDNNPVDGIGSN